MDPGGGGSLTSSKDGRTERVCQSSKKERRTELNYCEQSDNNNAEVALCSDVESVRWCWQAIYRNAHFHTMLVELATYRVVIQY